MPSLLTKSKIVEKNKEQMALEKAIVEYQKAYRNSNTILANKYYEQICEIYPPLRFIYVWQKKYEHLFDSKEDFIQDYLQKFHISLISWKPRNIRQASKYNGSGDFKNYFLSCLHHHYYNMIKFVSAAGRNQEKQCPICNKWVSPLSRHLIQSHAHLLWDRIQQMGFSLENLNGCPFCKSYKNSRIQQCEHSPSGCDACKKELFQKSLCGHFMSKHSAYLFEHFHELYPEHLTLHNKPISIQCEDENGDSLDLYDTMTTKPSIANLLALSLTKIQKRILNKILNGTTFKYSQSVYKCTYEVYTKDLEDLKNKMVICGLE